MTYNINDNKYSKKDNIKINKQINHNEVFDTITHNLNNIGENEQQKKNIISKIQITIFYIYLCSCCIRKRKIMHNYLLDEGMRIIIEKIDIFNIFDKMYKYEEIEEKVVINKTIEMSDLYKLKLQYMNFK